MECRHCRTHNQHSATSCAACGKPLLPPGRSRTVKRGGRHGRSGRTVAETGRASEQKMTAPRHGDRMAPATTPSGSASATAAPGRTLAVVQQVAEQGEAERKPTPLALAPQHLPIAFVGAQPSSAAASNTNTVAPNRSRRLRPFLFGGGLIAVLVVALSGVGRGTNQDGAAAKTAGAVDVLHSVAAPAPSPDENSREDAASASASPETAPHKLAVANKAISARKPVASAAPGPGKIAKHTANEHSGKLAANDSKKKRADNVAQAAPKSAAKLPPQASHEQDDALLASNTPAAHDKFAQCQALGSFLRREQCKWQVCGGKWGQDGCPSYASDNRASN